MKEDTILVPVKASEELPKESGLYFTSAGIYYYFPDRNYWEDQSENNMNLPEFWYKETTRSELLREELEKSMPSYEDIVQNRSNVAWRKKVFKSVFEEGLKSCHNYIKFRLNIK